MEIVKNFYFFIIHPSKEIKRKMSFKQGIFSILVLLIFSYVVLLMLSLIKQFLISHGILHNQADSNEPIQGIMRLLLFSVLIGPLIEESAFRLWLSYSRFGLSLSIIAFLFMLLGKFHIYRSIDVKQTALLVSAGLLIFGFFLWVLKDNDYKMEQFLMKYNLSFVILSATIFGYMHITNFVITKEVIVFSPFLLAPYIFNGLLYGYVRCRFGFPYAFLLHSINNLIPALITIFLLK